MIVVGLVTLVAGAEFLVRGSVWCALTLGISPMLVGLTLVAFGTSAPELVVSISAALKDSPGIATGTALGSNIANIGLIVGIAALIQPIVKSSEGMRFEIRYTILAAVLPLIPLLLGTPITLTHGLLMLGLLLVFLLSASSELVGTPCAAGGAGSGNDQITKEHEPQWIRFSAHPSVCRLTLWFSGGPRSGPSAATGC